MYTENLIETYRDITMKKHIKLLTLGILLSNSLLFCAETGAIVTSEEYAPRKTTGAGFHSRTEYAGAGAGAIRGEYEERQTSAGAFHSTIAEERERVLQAVAMYLEAQKSQRRAEKKSAEAAQEMEEHSDSENSLEMFEPAEGTLETMEKRPDPKKKLKDFLKAKGADRDLFDPLELFELAESSRETEEFMELARHARHQNKSLQMFELAESRLETKEKEYLNLSIQLEIAEAIEAQHPAEAIEAQHTAEAIEAQHPSDKNREKIESYAKEILKMSRSLSKAEFNCAITRFFANRLTPEAVSVFAFCMANPIDYLEAAECKYQHRFSHPLMTSSNGRHKWELDRALPLKHYLEEPGSKYFVEIIWLQMQLNKIYKPLQKIIEEIRKVQNGFLLSSIDLESNLPADFVPEEQNSEFTPDFSLDEMLASYMSPGVTTVAQRLFFKLLEKQESLLKIRG